MIVTYHETLASSDSSDFDSPVRMQGATPETLQKILDSRISEAQQSFAVSVEFSSGVHPTPPHSPQSSTQHTSSLVDSTPTIPPVQTAPGESRWNRVLHDQEKVLRTASSDCRKHRVYGGVVIYKLVMGTISITNSSQTSDLRPSTCSMGLTFSWRGSLGGVEQNTSVLLYPLLLLILV